MWHQTTECVQAAYLPPSQETHSHIKAASYALCTGLAHSTHSVDICWVACWWLCSSVPVTCPLSMPSHCLAWTSWTVNGSQHLQMSLWISQALATAAWRKSGFRKSLCSPAVTPTAALGDPNSGSLGQHGWRDPIYITQTLPYPEQHSPGLSFNTCVQGCSLAFRKPLHHWISLYFYNSL